MQKAKQPKSTPTRSMPTRSKSAKKKFSHQLKSAKQAKFANLARPVKQIKPSKPAKSAKPAKPAEQKGIPSKEECYRLWDGYHMPENIRRHTLQVTRIAVFLARKLNQNGVKVNVTLVERGALLHDIDKILTIKNNKHGEVAEQILLRRNYPELARIAITHRFKYIRDPTLSWEEKVVNYADKRVKHDQIVSLDERFTDLLIRYDVKVPDHEAIQMFFQLEKELFRMIHLDPMRLVEYLSKEGI